MLLMAPFSGTGRLGVSCNAAAGSEFLLEPKGGGVEALVLLGLVSGRTASRELPLVKTRQSTPHLSRPLSLPHPSPPPIVAARAKRAACPPQKKGSCPPLGR